MPIRLKRFIGCGAVNADKNFEAGNPNIVYNGY